MRIGVVIAMSMLLAPAQVIACQAGASSVARCVTPSGKTAEVCESPAGLVYTYGRPGATELALDNGQWNASSGTSAGGEQYVFRKDDYVYVLESYSCWRDCEGEKDSMELIVRRDSREMSRQQCASFEMQPVKHQQSSGDWE